jgi:hypothetical protein
MVGPPDHSATHASNEDLTVIKRKRGAKRITYTTIIENPNIMHENAETTAHRLHMTTDDIIGSEETKADTSEKTQMTSASQVKGS